METVVLRVSGMACSGCEQRISSVLRRVEGVREVSADHRTGVVRVRVGPELVDRAVLVLNDSPGEHAWLCCVTWVEDGLGMAVTGGRVVGGGVTVRTAGLRFG